jgi:hypothetical protein
MTDLTSKELFERIQRSLSENSEEFARQRKAQRGAKVKWLLITAAIFAAGIVAGTLVDRYFVL